MSVPPLILPFLDEAAIRSISIAADEPGWRLADRLDALARASTLPAESNLLFTPYLDLRAARFADVSVATETGVAPNAEVPLPAGTSAYLRVREDAVIERAISPTASDAGVLLATFAELQVEQPDLLERLLSTEATLPDDDAFAQVARATSALGLVIHVPGGVTLEAPIVLRWDLGSPGHGLVSRTIVSLGDDAHATLLEEQGDADSRVVDGTRSLWWGTLEVDLGAGATLDVAGLQDFDAATVAIINRQARIGQDARLQWALASVGSVLHRSRIDNLLVGRGARVRQVEIGFGDGTQLFDLTSYTHHIGEDTTGDLLSKGVFTDRSRGYIKGLIEIRRSAIGTDSFLGEFGMLLTRKARSVTVPSLEIDQPNVRRAAHSSSVGPIDEGQIFYLMSRGLDRDTARRFIVMGFLEPVVARIPLPDAQQRLRELLERKWPRAEDRQGAVAA